MGKIKANDEDLGVNADIKYSIINSEGANMFSIATDRDTREGVISLKKVRTRCLGDRNVIFQGLLRKICEGMVLILLVSNNLMYKYFKLCLFFCLFCLTG